MSFIGKTAIVLSAAGVVMAGMSMIQPHLAPQTPRDLQQIQEERRQKDWSDLNDSHEQQKDRHRDEGRDILEADQRDRLRPGQRRPPEVPRFRFLPK